MRRYNDQISMNNVFLLTGGNMGDRLQILEKALEEITIQIGAVIKKSSVYETAPWGIADQPAFLNQVLLVHSLLSPQDILKTILSIESNMGRKRNEKFGPRIIDIDLLFYNDLILQSPDLVIPHPEITNRRFVLVPLVELNKNYKHPVLKKSVFQLLNECPDHLQVIKF